MKINGVSFLIRLQASIVKKSKATSRISYNHKALTIFHHDPPNSHIPGFNFESLFFQQEAIVNLQRYL